jgi:RimJ/RimL family protein N-acetyltransferase
VQSRDAGPVPVTLEAGHFVLRPWTVRDSPTVHEVAADPLVARWNPFRPDPVSGGHAAAERWCLNRADWSTGEHASWAIAATSEPETALGSISLFKIDRDQRDCQVGYWVGTRYRHRGAATAALRAASGFAFARLGLHRIDLFHAVDNPGSCAVAVAAGYLQEGVLRASYRYGDGRYHDEHCHARLDTDPPPTG